MNFVWIIKYISMGQLFGKSVIVRKIYVAAVAVLLLNLLCPDASAGTRRALVIGIGEYEDAAWSRIHGDRDAEAVVGMLGRCGFGDVVSLVGREAVKEAVVREFRDLASRCSLGDTVYVHFSGHGQLMTDLDGDEADGWDESWVPYDACRKYCARDRGERHLCDDEVGELLDAVRERVGDVGVILVIVDACHAGDSTRLPCLEGMPVLRGVYDPFVIPGGGKTGMGGGKSPSGKSASGGTESPDGGARRKKLPERWLTLSACKDYQMNQELPSGEGRLTAALLSLGGRLEGLDNESVLRRINEFYNLAEHRPRYPQAAVMTGETSRVSISEVLR